MSEDIRDPDEFPDVEESKTWMVVDDTFAWEDTPTEFDDTVDGDDDTVAVPVFVPVKREDEPTFEALLHHSDPVSVGELAAETGLSDAVVEEQLRQFVADGLVRVVDDEPDTFAASFTHLPDER